MCDSVPGTLNRGMPPLNHRFDRNRMNAQKAELERYVRADVNKPSERQVLEYLWPTESARADDIVCSHRRRDWHCGVANINQRSTQTISNVAQRIKFKYENCRIRVAIFGRGRNRSNKH